MIGYGNSMFLGSTLLSGGGGSSFDPDAQAFFTATGITDATEKSAVNQLVLDYKSMGIWTNSVAIYPMVGGTATTHKFNLKNPLDTDAAFRGVFVGGWTHSNLGAVPNGVNAYMDTKIIPATHLSKFNVHFAKYNRTNDLAGTKSDAVYTGLTDRYFGIQYTFGYAAIGENSISGVIWTPVDTRGLFTASRTANNVFKVFKNSTQLGSTNTGTITDITGSFSMYIGARNNFGTAFQFNSYGCGFISFGPGLTDTQVADLRTAVQNFNTTLGRQV
jgi:hypothetical protein